MTEIETIASRDEVARLRAEAAGYERDAVRLHGERNDLLVRSDILGKLAEANERNSLANMQLASQIEAFFVGTDEGDR